MMVEKILALGDFHGSPGAVHQANRMADKYGCDAIIQVGDFHCYQQPSNVPLYFIRGNHEDWSVIGRHKNGQYEFADNVFFKEDYSVSRFGDLKIGYIGGVQRTSWHLSNRGKIGGYKKGVGPVSGSTVFDRSREEDRLWCHFDIENIGMLGGADVLVFHDKPWFSSKGGDTFLADVVADVRPDLVIHGHMHRYRVTEEVGSTIVSLPEAGGSGWFDDVTGVRKPSMVGAVIETGGGDAPYWDIVEEDLQHGW